MVSPDRVNCFNDRAVHPDELTPEQLYFEMLEPCTSKMCLNCFKENPFEMDIFEFRRGVALEKIIGFFRRGQKHHGYKMGVYMLATIQHECAGKWQPIREKGGSAYAQVTGESNYERQEFVIRKEYPEVVERFEKRAGKKFDLTAGDQPGDSAALTICLMLR